MDGLSHNISKSRFVGHQAGVACGVKSADQFCALPHINKGLSLS
jgi:hypothetical protein